MEHRERYREAFALTLKAWQAREIFAWNGRYFQLANVNLWPRPIQQPHPPVWVPGSGSISTFDFAVEHDVCYCFLSYSGARSAKTHDGRLLGRGGRRRGASAIRIARASCSSSRVRDRRARRGRVRAARRVLLPQVPARAAAVVLAAGQPGLPEPARRRAQSGAPRRRIPRTLRYRTSSTRATSSPAARPPCASASRRKSSRASASAT